MTVAQLIAVPNNSSRRFSTSSLTTAASAVDSAVAARHRVAAEPSFWARRASHW